MIRHARRCCLHQQQDLSVQGAQAQGRGHPIGQDRTDQRAGRDRRKTSGRERERDNDWKDPSLDECLESFGWMMMDAFGSSIKAHKGHHQLEDPSLHGFGSPWWVEQTPNQPPEKSSEERTNS